MTPTRHFLLPCVLGALALPGCAETDSDLFTAKFSGTPPAGGETLRLDEEGTIVNGRIVGDCISGPACAPSVLGAGIVIAGDLDADGFDDLLFHTMIYTDDFSAPHRGGVYVVYGRPIWADEATIEPDAVIGVDSDSQGSFALARAGDVDGDGYADFLIGGYERPACRGQDHPEDAEVGRVYLVYGGPARLSGSVPVADVASTIVDEAPCRGLGVAIASAGDLDGDGYGDFAAGGDANVHWPADPPGAGRVYLFYGGPRRLPAISSIASADATLRGRLDVGGFASGLASAGDIDGDGDSELLIAERVDYGIDKHGEYLTNSATYLVAGGIRLAGDLDATTAPGIATFTGYGLHGVPSAGLGDLDEDGLDDFALAGWATGEDVGASEVATFLFYGRPDGFGPSVSVSSADVIIRTSSFALMSFGAAADHDGDGHRDIVFGDAFFADWRGAAHLIRGTGYRWTGDFPLVDIATTYVGSERLQWFSHLPAGRTHNPVWFPEQAGDLVVGGGDVDGDGTSDLVIGAPGGETLGRAYILR